MQELTYFALFCVLDKQIVNKHSMHSIKGF